MTLQFLSPFHNLFDQDDRPYIITVRIFLEVGGVGRPLNLRLVR